MGDHGTPLGVPFMPAAPLVGAGANNAQIHATTTPGTPAAKARAVANNATITIKEH